MASSYGFSETDETMTAETITPNQLTLQAFTSDEEECNIDDITKDTTPLSYSKVVSQEMAEQRMQDADNISLSSDNESGNSIPINPDGGPTNTGS